MAFIIFDMHAEIKEYSGLMVKFCEFSVLQAEGSIPLKTGVFMIAGRRFYTTIHVFFSVLHVEGYIPLQMGVFSIAGRMLCIPTNGRMVI